MFKRESLQMVEETEGFFRKQKVWRLYLRGSRTNVTFNDASYRVGLAEQQHTPFMILGTRSPQRRRYWMYHGEYYVTDDEGLTPSDVRALIDDQRGWVEGLVVSRVQPTDRDRKEIAVGTEDSI